MSFQRYFGLAHLRADNANEMSRELITDIKIINH